MPNAIWIAVLRPSGGDIALDSVMSLPEVAQARMDLRLRYNPDMRLVTMRLPAGTRREQVEEAVKQLGDGERSRLYNSPQHRLVA